MVTRSINVSFNHKTSQKINPKTKDAKIWRNKQNIIKTLNFPLDNPLQSISKSIINRGINLIKTRSCLIVKQY